MNLLKLETACIPQAAKFTLFLLFITLSTTSDGQQIDFEKRIGTSSTADWGYSIAETYDNGYIIAGLTGAIGFGQEDIYLVKTDQLGDTIWTKTYGSLGSGEFAKSVIETADSGYAVLGYTESYGAGAADIYLIKTDINGDTLWTKTYGGPLNDQSNSIQETNDGGFIILGSTNNYGSGNSDIYLIKTDINGDILWTKTFGGAFEDAGTFVQQTSNNGYIITGYTYSFGADFIDLILIKVDALGSVEWQKVYDGLESGNYSGDYGSAVQETLDGGYIVTGTKAYTFMTNYTGQTWLLKTNSLGDTLWTKTFGQVNSDASNGADVKQCADGGYIVLSNRNTMGVGLDAYLIRTDLKGDTIWTKTIDGGDTEKGLSLLINSDQSYIIAGYAYDIINWHQVYLVKVSENTVTGINHLPNDEALPPAVAYPNPFKASSTLEFSNPNGLLHLVTLYDATGRIIRHYSTPKSSINMERKGMDSGLYFYTIKNKNELIYTGSLIAR